MASAAAAAAAPRPPAPPPPPPPPPPAAAAQWLGPRVSFSLDDAGGGGGREAAAAAGGKAGQGAGPGADFEFLLGGCAAACSMLPADELFSGGKLVPLRIPASTDETAAAAAGAEAEVTAQSTLLMPPKKEQQPETPRAEAEAAAAEPKVPARRWRDLLRLRKQQASPGAAAEPRPLRRLLRRGPKPPEPEPSLSLPLLREPGPEEPNITTNKTASQAQHQSLLPPNKIRLSSPSPSASQQQHASASQSAPPPPPPPPPPPSAVAADSPRLNAAGKVVFNGLGRSSSSPSSLAGGRRHRSAAGAMERSYSAHVRVAPVLNVPVCSLRGSRRSAAALGMDRLFAPSSSGASSSSSAGATKKNRAAKKDVAPGAGAH